MKIIHLNVIISPFSVIVFINAIILLQTIICNAAKLVQIFCVVFSYLAELFGNISLQTIIVVKILLLRRNNIVLLFYLPIFDGVGGGVEIDADFYDWQVGERKSGGIVFQIYLIQGDFCRFVEF